MDQLGVIFDMDGVLIDSADAHWRSWDMLARETGSDFPASVFAESFGRQNKDIIPLYFGRSDEAGILELADRKESLYRDIIRDAVPAMPGAIELVRALYAAGFTLAVGSSGPPENVELAIDGLGLTALFSSVITARETPIGKPDPLVFRLAAQGMGTPPDGCAVIEDAPAGIEAALAGGMCAIGIAGTHGRTALDRAHLIVDQLSELTPSRISELIRRQ